MKRITALALALLCLLPLPAYAAPAQVTILFQGDCDFIAYLSNIP